MYITKNKFHKKLRLLHTPPEAYPVLLTAYKYLKIMQSTYVAWVTLYSICLILLLLMPYYASSVYFVSQDPSNLRRSLRVSARCRNWRRWRKKKFFNLKNQDHRLRKRRQRSRFWTGRGSRRPHRKSDFGLDGPLPAGHAVPASGLLERSLHLRDCLQVSML